MGSRYYRFELAGESGYLTLANGTDYLTQIHQLYFHDASPLNVRGFVIFNEGSITYTAEPAPLSAGAQLIPSTIEIITSPGPLVLEAVIQARHEISELINLLPDTRAQLIPANILIITDPPPLEIRADVVTPNPAIETVLAAIEHRAQLNAATFDLVPDTPTNFVAKRNASLDGYKKTELSCDAVDGASDYEWYRAKGQRSSYSLLATTGTPSYTDSPIDEDIAYSYAVLAKTSDGTRGPKTKSVYTRGKRTHI